MTESDDGHEPLGDFGEGPRTAGRGRRYWKVSPGKDGVAWDAFRDRGFVASAWTDSTDLRNEPPSNQQELRAHLTRLGMIQPGAVSIAASQLWNVYHDMRPGDFVCAYARKTVLGWGDIAGDYVFEEDGLGFPHRRPVRWRSTDPVSTGSFTPALRQKLAGRLTIIDLDAKDFAEIIGKEPLILPVDAKTLLGRSLAAAALRYTPWQIATFYTALQTKGFVILSGISGTGKTKLAQHFGELLPRPNTDAEPPEQAIVLTVQPYMLDHGHITIPKAQQARFNVPAVGEGGDVAVRFGDQEQPCKLSTTRADFTVLLLRGTVRSWFGQRFALGDTFALIPELDEHHAIVSFRIVHRSEWGFEARDGEPKAGRNTMFLSVRPDWRDSKSLLGYHNPLTGTYEWTPFLRFLLRAVASYEAADGLAWFVILDEMNLAHVEYYFADLLSVLESGRDEAGWTREAVRLGYPDEAEGDLPPREVRVPPNLYVVGTVNMDETTHAFSPKVLDRAFTLELADVSFAGYPPSGGAAGSMLSDDQRRGLLAAFTEGGRFARVEKERIGAYVEAHPAVRNRLQSLNGMLRPHNLHFGYRVFDEIVAFLDAAERNGMFEGLGELAAFDAAVLMKVLPKFHGSRGRLEAPLRAVLAWCVNPDDPDMEAVNDAFRDVEDASRIIDRLDAMDWRCPMTARRAGRMVWTLYTEGFAAFG